MASPAFKFDEFELDPAAFELRKNGHPIRLERIPLKLLLLLVSRKGELVSRSEIIEKLWGSEVYIETGTAINVAVRKVRLALRDNPESPRFLLTVPGQGYRFVGSLIEESKPLVVGPIETGHLPPVEPPQVSIGRDDQTVITSLLRRWGVWTALGILMLLGGFFLRPYLLRPSHTSVHRIMLGVLPFKNLSADPNQEYIVDGLTEDTITDLGQMSPAQLGVIARTSAMAYKHSDKTVSQIGRELGVDYVLEGSVRSEGGKARVSAQLIRVSDQTHLWAKNYDRDLRDLLEIENELGRTIAQQVQVNLGQQWQVELAKARSVDPEAYDLYLRGRYYWNQRTPGGIKESIGYFQQAIAKDPDFALAYAGLADAYNLANIIAGYPAKDSLPAARTAATRAIALDPFLADPHAALGMVKSHYEFDFPGAEKEFLRAIELNPNSAYAHLFYGNCYLLPVGRTQDAIAENRKALELDPLSLPINNFMGITYAYAGDYEKSYKQFQHTIEMDPTFPLAHLYLSGVLQFMGRYRESIQEFEKSRLLSGSDPDAAGREAADRLQAFNEGGEKGFWQHALARMLQPPQGTQPQSDLAGDLAVAYAMAGDKDNAFEWLNKVYEEREGRSITLLKCDPYFKRLRGDPRYVALLHKLGLPE